MITLIYSGNNPKLAKAVANANDILSADAFYEKIAALPGYDPKSSAEIATSLQKANLEIIIVSYRNPFGKRTTKGVTPFLFKVNTSKISSVIAFAVHSLIRQTVLNFSSVVPKKRIEALYQTEKEKIENLPTKIGEIAEIISRKARCFA